MILEVIKIDKNITDLRRQFIRIKNMGYVKSVRSGSTGIGATFEFLLGKSEESFEIPDYEGIEIKTKRGYSKSNIFLFNAVPTGGSFYEVKRLRDNYGWPMKKDNELKCLYAEVSAIIKSKVGIWHYYKLDIDEVENRLYLEIYNLNWELIDKETYWDLDVLKEKLYRKLQILALVKAWPNNINGEEYYKYYNMHIYILKKFDCFISAIKNGKITVNLRISTFTDEKRYGNVDSHGVGFGIHEEDLLDIFELYR